jgi:2-dehydropantoate 2-reductase
VSTSKNKEYVAVVGPGAIGGLLAASLREKGLDVLLVGHSTASVKALKRSGITATCTKGKSKRYRGWLEISTRPKRRPGCTAVFLTVKAQGVPSAIRAIKGIVSPETAIVPLINGVSHITPLRKAFGTSKTVFGACYIAAMRKSSTSTVHTGGGGIALAKTKENAAAFTKARKILKTADWTVRSAEHPDRLLWTKTIYNAAVNPIGTLTRKTNGELASIPALRDLVSKTVQEAALIARAAGYRPVDPNPVAAVLKGCRSAPQQLNSMAQDIERGRKTEIDAILKPLLNAAKKQRRQTRYLEPLYMMIRRLEQR